jgi:hypothetical protein
VDHVARHDHLRWRAVGPDRGQRVEHVGHREHAGRQRDDLARQPVRVAAAVPALVVMADHQLGLAEELDLAQDLPAHQRMALHQRPLFRRQRLGLPQDRVRHRDLADVVQQEAELDLGVVDERRVEHPGDLHAVGGDALGVLAGVGVTRLDGVAQRAHRGHV